MQPTKRFWNGKTVHVAVTNSAHDNRSIEIGLKPETARELALALRRLQQTSLASAPGVDELVNALDYVLIGDPFSRTQHAAMERAKDVRMGPTDADFARGLEAELRGELKPDHEFLQHPVPSAPGEYRCGYARSQTDASSFCWKTKEEHDG